MSAYTQGTPADVFVWEVPGKSIAVHLSLDVVDQILPDVLRGFAAVPKRGAEVGGILLGNVEKDGDRTIVHIEDCEMVQCEYKHGPSYLLSEEDLDAFDETCAKWESAPGGIGPVGFYRSHTREGMKPEPDDVDLCANYFPDPSNILLLIKPHATKPGTAGFFFYENGRFQDKTYLEFPFRRRELSGQGPEVRRPLGERSPERPAAESVVRRMPTPMRAPEPKRQAPELEEQIEEPPPRYQEQPLRTRATEQIQEPLLHPVREQPYAQIALPRQRFRWIWIPLSFIFLLMGVVLGFQSALSWGGRVGASPAPETFVLGLRVQKVEDNLSVQWDRNAPAVKISQKGILAIDEGGAHKSVELDTPQLQTGGIIYRVSGDNVKFRLEVFPRERSSVAETTTWHKE